MSAFTYPSVNDRPRRTLASRLGLAGLWAAAGLFMLVVSFIIAAFPTKLTVVMIAGAGGLSTLLFAWMFRDKRNAAPGSGFLAMLMVLVVLSAVWPRYVFFSVGGPRVNPLTLSIVAIFGISILWFAFSPAFSGRLIDSWSRGGALRWLIPLWMAWGAVACVFGEHPLPSLVVYLHELVYLGSFFLIGCLIASYDNGPRLVLRVLVAATLLLSLAGVAEAVLHKNYFIRFVSNADSKDVNDAIASIVMDKARGGAMRIQASFDHPIVFAQFLSAMLPILYFFIRHERSALWRLAAWATLLPLLVSLVKTGSRAGLVSAAVAALVLGAVYWLRAVGRGNLARMVAVVSLPMLLVGLAGSYLVVKEYAAGRTSTEANSSKVRLHQIYMGASALADSPITGYGTGMAVEKAGVFNTKGLATIDNYFLTVALDEGYVGLLLFVAILAVYASRGLAASYRLPGEEGVLVGSYTAAVMAIASTFIILSIPNNLTLIWILVTGSFPLLNRAQALSPVAGGVSKVAA